MRYCRGASVPDSDMDWSDEHSTQRFPKYKNTDKYLSFRLTHSRSLPNMETPKTTILEFDDSNRHLGVGLSRLSNSMAYLGKKYQIEITFAGETAPYMDLWCDKLPPASERPFMIARLLAVWVAFGEDGRPLVTPPRVCAFPLQYFMNPELTSNTGCRYRRLRPRR